MNISNFPSNMFPETKPETLSLTRLRLAQREPDSHIERSASLEEKRGDSMSVVSYWKPSWKLGKPVRRSGAPVPPPRRRRRRRGLAKISPKFSRESAIE